MFTLMENFDIFILEGNQLDSVKTISSNQTSVGCGFNVNSIFKAFVVMFRWAPCVTTQLPRWDLCGCLTCIQFSGLWWAVQGQIHECATGGKPRNSQTTIAAPSLSFPSLQSLVHLLVPWGNPFCFSSRRLGFIYPTIYAYVNKWTLIHVEW